MIAQFVQFESSLSDAEVLAVARKRLPDFQAIPELRQKFYLKLQTPDHYGGFYIWETREALARFRQSDLAKTIPDAYRITGAPDVGIHDILLPLRPDALPRTRAAV